MCEVGTQEKEEVKREREGWGEGEGEGGADLGLLTEAMMEIQKKP